MCFQSHLKNRFITRSIKTTRANAILTQDREGGLGFIVELRRRTTSSRRRALSASGRSSVLSGIFIFIGQQRC